MVTVGKNKCSTRAPVNPNEAWPAVKRPPSALRHLEMHRLQRTRNRVLVPRYRKRQHELLCELCEITETNSMLNMENGEYNKSRK